MNVSLTPYWERYVREKVESGRYNNASEVIREALRKMEFVEDVKEFRAFAMEAMDPANRDKLIEMEPDHVLKLAERVIAGARLSTRPTPKYLLPPEGEEFGEWDPAWEEEVSPAHSIAEDGEDYDVDATGSR